jgi:polysaccharide pyruvyl transferase WcaK-like protein
MKTIWSDQVHTPPTRATSVTSHARNAVDGNIRILVEPSEFTLLNAGDAAMMRVEVARLRSMWPNATIQVLTDAPDRVLRYCPSAQPLLASGRHVWVADGALLPGSLYRSLPRWAKNYYLVLERHLKCRWTAAARFVLRVRLGNQPYTIDALDQFLEAASNADLVVVAGMGSVTDAFADYSSELFQSLEIAIENGAVAVMVGQGLGPISDPVILARAKAVLAGVDFISLREGLHGPSLLHELGFPANRLMVTGDDAIEFAYASRTECLGSGMGVCIRFADYAQVQAHHLERIGLTLQQAARDLNTTLVPVPVSRIPGEADTETIRQLLEESGERADEDGEIDAPLNVIERIRRCRLVVTGSYHAGVFALSMGVPVIGLASSDYYRVKFSGLAHQFGTGCEVIDLGDAEFPAHLGAAIRRCWETADEVRPGILERAAGQIALGTIAFERIYEIANRRWQEARAQTPQAFVEGLGAPTVGRSSS